MPHKPAKLASAYTSSRKSVFEPKQRTSFFIPIKYLRDTALVYGKTELLDEQQMQYLT